MIDPCDQPTGRADPTTGSKLARDPRPGLLLATRSAARHHERRLNSPFIDLSAITNSDQMRSEGLDRLANPEAGALEDGLERSRLSL